MIEFAYSDSTQSPRRFNGRFVDDGMGVRVGGEVNVRVGERATVGLSVGVSASRVDVAVAGLGSVAVAIGV